MMLNWYRSHTLAKTVFPAEIQLALQPIVCAEHHALNRMTTGVKYTPQMMSNINKINYHSLVHIKHTKQKKSSILW